MSRYCSFLLLWQDIHTKVLAEIKWKDSHKFACFKYCKKMFAMSSNCCLWFLLWQWILKEIGRWKIFTLEKNNLHVSIATRSLSCQDTVAFDSNDKTFTKWLQQKLNERTHTNFACFKYYSNMFSMSKNLLVVPAMTINSKNLQMKKYSHWRKPFACQ